MPGEKEGPEEEEEGRCINTLRVRRKEGGSIVVVVGPGEGGREGGRSPRTLTMVETRTRKPFNDPKGAERNGPSERFTPSQNRQINHTLLCPQLRARSRSFNPLFTTPTHSVSEKIAVSRA
jgi:hypothetical protein